ncbi:hypothetical protein CN918_28290 [Priestia megaterium]|nr:hypothetical protein CN918_28290 [Priestia megaterium]
MAHNHEKKSSEILQDINKTVEQGLSKPMNQKEKKEFLQQYQSGIDAFVKKSKQEQKDNDQAVADLDKQMQAIIDSLDEQKNRDK